MSDITAVIATKGRHSSLQRAVDNFRNHGIDRLVIIDQSPSRTDCFDGDARLIYRHEPAISTASEARNLGASLASGKWLWFADDDCWLCQKLVIPQGLEDEPLVFFPWHSKNSRLASLVLRLHYWLPRNRFYWWLIPLTGTPFWVLKASLFQTVLFDETLGPGSPFPTSEDLDMVYRFVQRYKCFGIAGSGVVEHELELQRGAKRKLHRASRLHVLRKHSCHWLLALHRIGYAFTYSRIF